MKKLHFLTISPTLFITKFCPRFVQHFNQPPPPEVKFWLGACVLFIFTDISIHLTIVTLKHSLGATERHDIPVLGIEFRLNEDKEYTMDECLTLNGNFPTDG